MSQGSLFVGSTKQSKGVAESAENFTDPNGKDFENCGAESSEK